MIQDIFASEEEQAEKQQGFHNHDAHTCHELVFHLHSHKHPHDRAGKIIGGKMKRSK